MASPHVTGIVALLVATKRLGRHPSPELVKAHLEATATDARAARASTTATATAS